MKRLGALGYAAPALGATFLFSPAGGMIQALYGKYFGLSLEAIAAAMLVARLFDAVVDPVIGVLSDRFSDRSGERRSSVVLGALWLLGAAALLWVPLQPGSIAYFAAVSILYYLGWSLFDIPHCAWAAEISADGETRARYYAWRTGALYLGNLLFAALPMLVLGGGGEFDPASLRNGLVAAAAVMAAGLVLMFVLAPAGRRPAAHGRDTLADYLRSVARNPLLLSLMGAYLAAGLAFGGWFAVLFLFVDGYLGLGRQMSLILLCGTATGLVAIPVWLRLLRRLDKKGAWAASIGLSAVLMAGSVLLAPGPWALGLMLAMTCAIFVCFAAQNLLIPSLMADVVDYGRLRFGANRAGAYFAFLTTVTKANTALGAAIGFFIAGRAGFDAADPVHTPQALLGLKIAFCGAPALFAAVAFFLVLKSPFSRRRQAIVARRLAKRPESYG